MSVLDILWQLNVTDTTKYLIIVGIVICILFIFIMSAKKKEKYSNLTKPKNKQKKSKKSNLDQVDIDKEYFEYYHEKKPTKCQFNYIKCVEDNVKNKTNKYCYPCMENGNAPDFSYNPVLNQWVKN